MIVKEKAIDLGKTVTETDEYKNLQRAQAAVSADGEASKLLQDFQRLRNSYERMRSMGHKLEKQHMEKLEQLHNKMMQNQLLKDYEEARSKFDSLLSEINAKINEGMGKKQGQGSCGSDCGSGGCNC